MKFHQIDFFSVFFCLCCFPCTICTANYTIQRFSFIVRTCVHFLFQYKKKKKELLSSLLLLLPDSHAISVSHLILSWKNTFSPAAVGVCCHCATNCFCCIVHCKFTMDGIYWNVCTLQSNWHTNELLLDDICKWQIWFMAFNILYILAPKTCTAFCLYVCNVQLFCSAVRQLNEMSVRSDFVCRFKTERANYSLNFSVAM